MNSSPANPVSTRSHGPLWECSDARLLPRLACLILASCPILGCGEPPAYQPPLEGVIQWSDGSEPRELEGGTIEFHSDGKVVAQTGLVGDGTFMLGKALFAGNYQVRILPPPGAAKTALD